METDVGVIIIANMALVPGLLTSVAQSDSMYACLL
jgi:hypothetical protein